MVEKNLWCEGRIGCQMRTDMHGLPDWAHRGVIEGRKASIGEGGGLWSVGKHDIKLFIALHFVHENKLKSQKRKTY